MNNHRSDIRLRKNPI